MRSPVPENALRSFSGFTLIELVLVIALLGTAVLLAPSHSIFEDMVFRSDARRVAALIRHLDDSSITKNEYYMLTVDLGGNYLKTASSIDGSSFSEAGHQSEGIRLGRGASVEEIALGSGARQNTGTASILFYPGSGAEAFSVVIKNNGREAIDISYNPYSGRVKIS